MRPSSFSGPRARRFLSLATFTVPTALFFACGSRTPLAEPETATVTPDGSVTIDGQTPRDAARDQLTDSFIPGIDAQVRDANRDDCPDADATFVYVVTEQNELLAFNPPAASFKKIGLLSCPTKTPGSTPFSMAVDRTGVAYVLFNDGNLFRVSTKTAACVATNFAPNQQGFQTFGMGFSSNAGGPAETLFIASDESTGGGNLGSIDVQNFTVNPVAAFNPPINRAELTGTGDGRLFAFYTDTQSSNYSFIGEIDKQNANVIGEEQLDGVRQGQGWAFAYWGGDFYTFTSPTGGGSKVQRFRPLSKQITQVATYPTIIVGAGVSTCAPQQ